MIFHVRIQPPPTLEGWQATPTTPTVGKAKVNGNGNGMLSGKTWVPMAAAVAVLIAAVSGAWAVRGALGRVEAQMITMQLESTHEFQLMAARLAVVETQLQYAAEDRWRARDMRLWVGVFQDLNQGGPIKIPDVPK